MVGAMQGDEALRMPGRREDRRGILHSHDLVGWRLKDQKRLLHSRDPVVQPGAFDILQKLALDLERPPGERHGGLALLADFVQMGLKASRHMRSVRRRADGRDRFRLRYVVRGSQNRRAAKAVPDENINRHQRLTQVGGSGDQILNVGGEVRIREFALAHAEAREIEAQDGEPALSEFARDPGRGKNIFRAGEAVREKRERARLSFRVVEPCRERRALRPWKSYFLRTRSHVYNRFTPQIYFSSYGLTADLARGPDRRRETNHEESGCSCLTRRACRGQRLCSGRWRAMVERLRFLSCPALAWADCLLGLPEPALRAAAPRAGALLLRVLPDQSRQHAYVLTAVMTTAASYALYCPI